MKSDLVVTTWSHSSYSDIWDMYYGQYEKHAPFLEHYMMVNEICNGFPENCAPLLNDETQKFGARMVDSLSKINNQNIIYTQEDFVLYDDVEEGYMDSLTSFLNDSKYSFIRLMKSGFFPQTNHGTKIHEELNIWEVPKGSPYLYTLQATIWKREELIRLMDFFKPRDMMQAEIQGSYACRSLNIQGCYIHAGEKQRGRLHWDSSGYPYISTALYGGSQGKRAQWATTEYPELNKLLEEYNIDVNERGVR